MNKLKKNHIISFGIIFFIYCLSAGMYHHFILNNSNMSNNINYFVILIVIIAISLFALYTTYLLNYFYFNIHNRNQYNVNTLSQKFKAAFNILSGSFILSFFFDRVILVGLYFLVFSQKLLLTNYLSYIIYFSWARIGIWFIIGAIILLTILIGFEKSFKYRYLISIITFLYLIIGQYHGSSIGFLAGMLTEHTDTYQKTTLLGINQGLRGDEWAVWLPLKISQIENDFQYFNYNLMLEGCDSMVSGKLPTHDLMTLTRQKNWGYYFLPLEYAVSFEWWSSLFLIFLSSIDMMYEITHRRKISVLYALMIIFSPCIQWWNSLWVIIYCGQYFVVALSKFLNSQKFVSKIIYTALASICAISYIFDLYPAWQIPFAYIFLIISLWILWQNKEQHPFKKGNLPYYFVVIFICFIFSMRFLYLSKDAMMTQLNTIYPGGGNWVTVPYNMPILQIINFFMAWGKYSTYLNNCEISQFYGMFLWSFILWIYTRFKKLKSPNSNLITALIICSIAYIYFIYGPRLNLLYKITLLSSTYPRRVYTAFGYCTVLVLFLTIGDSEYISGITKKASKNLVILIATAVCILIIADKTIQNYMQDSTCITILMVLLIEAWTYIGYSIITVKNSKKGLILLVFLTILSTVCVNPINRGLDDFSESTLVQAVKHIDTTNNHNGRWMVNGNTTIANIISACGIKRTTGTYIYPDFAMMEIIDPEYAYIDVWNRYAHIDMKLGSENTVTPNGVGLSIQIDWKTAKKLDLQYIVTNKKIIKTDYDHMSFEALYKDSNWYIYKIIYEAG